jgi:hypothetical protein
MPPPRRSSKRLHPALSLLLALGCHAAVFVVLGSIVIRPPAPAAPIDAVAAPVEIALENEADPSSSRERSSENSAPAVDGADGPAAAALAPAAAAPQAAPSSLRDESAAPSRSARRHRVQEAAGELATLPQPDSAAPSTEDEAVAGAPGAAPAGSAAVPHIDLGLNDGVRRAALLGGWLEPIAPPKKPTDGGLKDGLAALDAQRGLAMSSPANHAGYEAARRFAPPNGMGVFDILTDERGVVLSVKLASAPSDEARWQRVGQELEQILKERRLRVPAGAKGLEARLRIETGDLALDSTERFSTKRGAALGQSSSDSSAARFGESTRASLEPGVLSPTLGITIAGGGSGQRIRVVLVSERPL